MSVNLQNCGNAQGVDQVLAQAPGGVEGVTGVQNVRDGAAARVAEVCGERLVSVAFYPSYTTDAGVAALAGGCPSLSTISLYNSKQVTDAGIAAVA